ncbi:hypothetical protein BOM_1201 (plasmid) [Borrelia miyamotoi FR64b]|uniref:Uncharacterized protein n=1 Tax=Borrelia miyamotoi FR64b TaxID=1292392 RepID=W5SF70_9SPIR|nr:hypothetical protein BOM_1201 [Borrelia miyamotoi FR64b]
MSSLTRILSILKKNFDIKLEKVEARLNLILRLLKNPKLITE